MAREREFVSSSELALISYSFLPSGESRRRGSRAQAECCLAVWASALPPRPELDPLGSSGVENEASGLFFGMERGLFSGRSESISLNFDLSSLSPVSLVILKVAPTPWGTCYPFLDLVSAA